MRIGCTLFKKTYTKRSMKKNPLKITLLCIQAITIDRHACNYLYTVNYLSNPNKSSKVNKTPLISVHDLYMSPRVASIYAN